MNTNIADQLIEEAKADLSSLREWDRTLHFFQAALSATSADLPAIVQQELKSCAAAGATPSELEAARLRLWTSIADDRMGATPVGAATRAALFAFYPPDEEDPAEAIWLFCEFFQNAGLNVDAVVSAFRTTWPVRDDA